jgi:hypothetical protein
VTQARTVVLDNEAVQVLADPAHSKHRRILAALQAVAGRNRRQAGSARLVVPTCVRVEAGWDRRAPGGAAINHVRAEDIPLDAGAADKATRVRADLGVSVTDAHLAAVLDATAGPHAVLTSDIDDLRRIATHLDVRLNIVAV